MTPATWATLMTVVGQHVALFIGGGVSAAIVVFVIVLGIRRGIGILRYVAQTPRSGNEGYTDAMFAEDEAAAGRGEW